MGESSKRPHRVAISVTPRMGRLRVRDHCSFFWAEVPSRRLVVREVDHCDECLAYVRNDAEEKGFTFETIAPDDRTSEVLRRALRAGPDLMASFRRNRRVGCVMRVEVLEDAAEQAGVCRSISRGGLFVTGVNLPTNENLRLAIHVPGFGAVAAIGRVAYSYEHPDGLGTGVVFTEIEPEDAGRIEQFIQLAGPRPRVG